MENDNWHPCVDDAPGKLFGAQELMIVAITQIFLIAIVKFVAS